MRKITSLDQVWLLPDLPRVGGKIAIFHQSDELSPMEKLCQDLVEIVILFFSKIYSHRTSNRKCSSLIKSATTAD
jgi:hypothetical protein